MLQAYIDDSKQDGIALILAGYVAHDSEWAKFSVEWNELLSIRPPWQRFKMSEIMAAGGDESLERAKHHFRLVEKYALAGFTVAVPIADHSSAAQETSVPVEVRNPYFFAWRAIISLYAANCGQMGLDEDLQFIFDQQSEGTFITNEWNAIRGATEHKLRRRLTSTPIFRSDDEHLPIQAADMLAWWVRKRYLEHSCAPELSFPFPWKRVSTSLLYWYVPIDRAFMVKCFREDAIRTLSHRDPSGRYGWRPPW